MCKIRRSADVGEKFLSSRKESFEQHAKLAFIVFHFTSNKQARPRD